jgi:hypothetical protein
MCTLECYLQRLQDAPPVISFTSCRMNYRGSKELVAQDSLDSPQIAVTFNNNYQEGIEPVQEPRGHPPREDSRHDPQMRLPTPPEDPVPGSHSVQCTEEEEEKRVEEELMFIRQ